MELFLPCLYAFLACLGFCVLFRINGLGAVLCSLGGALAWLVYLLTGPIMGNNDVIQYFWAAVFLSAYAEVMARVRKCPATGYLLIAFIPLVPGAGIYYTAYYFIQGENALSLANGISTFKVAVALAVGIALVLGLPMPKGHRWKSK